MTSARQPAGDAGGALDGEYPQPSLGATCLAGYSLRDEFIRGGNNPVGTWGDLLWRTQQIGGTAPAPSDQTPVADTEIGILRLSTNVAPNDGDGGMLGWPGVSPMYRAFAPATWGSLWNVKIRLPGLTTTMKAWSGFVSDYAVAPAGVGVCSFVGLRYDSTIGPNWYMVVRAGAAETTQDTGVAANGNWAKFAIRRFGSLSTFTGFQLYTIAQSDVVIGYTAVGNPINSNVPVVNMKPCALGVICSGAAAQRTVEIDYYELSGRVAR